VDSVVFKQLPHVIGMEDEPDVDLCAFGPLAPGRYTTRVTWDGKALPVVESDVRALETSEVRVTPR
jgi:hypothetical protein